MAENNQRKFAQPVELDDQDPFAELTRIMGFDPRVPVRANPESEAPASERAVGPQTRAEAGDTPPLSSTASPAWADEETEFGIDLEKELLGELAYEAGQEPAAADASSTAPVFADEIPGFEDEHPAAEAFPEGEPPTAERELTEAVRSDLNWPEAQPGSPQALREFAEAAFSRSSPVQPEAEPESYAKAEAADHPEQAASADLLLEEFDGAFEEVFATHRDEAAPIEPVTLRHPTEDTAGVAKPEADEFPIEFDFDRIDLEEQSPLAGLPPEPEAELRVPEPVADAALEQAVAKHPGFLTGPGSEMPQVEPDDARPAQAGQPAFAPAESQAEPLIDLRLEDFSLDEELLRETGTREMLEPPHLETTFQAEPHVDLGHFEIDDFADEQDDAPYAEASVQPGWPADEPVPPTPPLSHVFEPQNRFAEVDMDFSAAFEQELASEAIRPVHDIAADEPQPGDGAGLSVEPVGQPEPVELSLEEELAALLRPRGQGGQPEGAPMHRQDDSRAFHDASTVAPVVRNRPVSVQEPDLDALLKEMEGEAHLAPPAGFATQERRRPAAVRISYDDRRDDPATRQAHAREEAIPDPESATAANEAPEIETVEVPEKSVALAHELEIPDITYDETPPKAQVFDEIDSEFAAAFQNVISKEDQVDHNVRGYSRPAGRAELRGPEVEEEAGYDEHFDGGEHDGRATVIPFQATAAKARGAAQSRRQDYDEDDGFREPGIEADDFEELDVHALLAEEGEQGPVTQAVAASPSSRHRRKLLIAGVVAGVALLGGAGSLALSYAVSDSADVPVLVKADDSPVKVKPENPGGVTVPNQENKVYEAVKGKARVDAEPRQQRLVSTSEEPVDMAALDQDVALPGVDTDPDIPAATEPVAPKSEDRIAVSETEGRDRDGIVVAPRKVKTMVVRADGTLVPREEVKGDVPVETTVSADSTGAVALPEVSEPVETSQAKPSALPPAADLSQASDAGAEAPKEQKVASAEPVEQAAAAGGAWSVQIASQPSAESAKSTYEDLARRFASVIGGRGVNIVKAEIAGKGTYWRVRVPAASRAEAVKLCADYKAAGGNCFISK